VNRPEFREYFLNITDVVATRGECKRSQVAAVIVNASNRIVATGYNGVRPGQESCLDGVCPRERNNVPRSTPYEDGGACIAIHAERNAIWDAESRNIDVTGMTMYLNKEPCETCLPVLTLYRMGVVWRDLTRSDGTTHGLLVL
jgi:dCMP deaminase